MPHPFRIMPRVPWNYLKQFAHAYFPTYFIAVNISGHQKSSLKNVYASKTNLLLIYDKI